MSFPSAIGISASGMGQRPDALVEDGPTRPLLLGAFPKSCRFIALSAPLKRTLYPGSLTLPARAISAPFFSSQALLIKSLNVAFQPSSLPYGTLPSWPPWQQLPDIPNIPAHSIKHCSRQGTGKRIRSRSVGLQIKLPEMREHLKVFQYARRTRSNVDRVNCCAVQ